MVAMKIISPAVRFIACVSLLWFIAVTTYYSHRGGWSLLFLFSLSLCFLAAVVLGIACALVNWEQRRWRSIFPLAICGLALYSSDLSLRILVPANRRAIFEWSLPSYEAIVHQIDTGIIPVSDTLTRIADVEQKIPLAYAVFAQRDGNDVLIIEFLTEAGFPVKHSGYMYVSSGTVEPGSFEDLRWPIRQNERPNWFYISD